MEVKDIIKVLEDNINRSSGKWVEIYGEKKLFNTIITLLKREEKYEEMLEKIIDELLHSKEDYACKCLYGISQWRRKYFPEDIGKIIS